jgi:hypothetical protein
MTQGFTHNLPVPLPVSQGGTGSTSASSARAALGAAPAVANYIISSSSGAFTTTSVTPVDVTNLSVSITTTGNPVYVTLIPDGSANFAKLQCPVADILYVNFARGATSLGQMPLTTPGTANAIAIPPGAAAVLDAQVAGTYTYKLQAATLGGVGQVQYCKLAAWEL